MSLFCICLLLLSTTVESQITGAIRLWVNGVTSPSLSSGRVQVFYDDRWGNICGDVSTSPFGQGEADVTCRHFGFVGASGHSIASNDQYGTDTLTPVIDDIMCPFTAMIIFRCSFSTVIDSSCTANDDVGVMCYTTRLWYDAYPGRIRLQGGNYTNEGHVEMYCNGQWMAICGDSLTDNDATAICRQLGYSEDNSTGVTVQTRSVGVPQIFTSFNCQGNSPESCTDSCISCAGVNSSEICPYPVDAYISCAYTGYTTLPDSSVCQTRDFPHSDGAIRLGGSGSTPNAGRVQIYLNGVWGNICSKNSFINANADVICHQIGYTGSASWSETSNDLFGLDSRPTLINDVSCSSSLYLTIFQCTHSTVIGNGCTDNDDVSVMCYTSRIWDNPFAGMVRLVDGYFTNQGRIEVYCNGLWGTICERSFDHRDAIVICNQLGYNSYKAVNFTTVSSVSSNKPIWLNNVKCTSNSSCVSECQLCPFQPISDCSHNEDVHIACEYSNDPSTMNTVRNLINTCKNSTEIPRAINPVSGTVILTRNGVYSKSHTSGRVVVYGRREIDINQQVRKRQSSNTFFWGNICRFASFNSTASDVICRQLGFSGSSSWSYSSLDLFGVDTNRTLLNNVRCSNNQYVALYQCSSTTIIRNSCGDGDDISVSCYSVRIWDNPYSGQIRLTGGVYANDGLLEIYCNGRWGTVCDDFFGINEARASCRQLGYSSVYQYDYDSSIRGDPGQPIWFNSVSCSSLETCLSSCQNCPTNENRDCAHSEDITLQCHSSSDDIAKFGIDGTCAALTPTPSLAWVSAVVIIVCIVAFSIAIGVPIYSEHKKGNMPCITKLSDLFKEKIAVNYCT